MFPAVPRHSPLPYNPALEQSLSILEDMMNLRPVHRVAAIIIWDEIGKYFKHNIDSFRFGGREERIEEIPVEDVNYLCNILTRSILNDTDKGIMELFRPDCK